MRGSRQLRFRLKERFAHGGRRKNAGRKPRGALPGVSHHGRSAFTYRDPLHVTLRVLPHVWNLHSRRSFRVIEAALEGVKARESFRVVHFSTQGNHLHLVCEADDSKALSSGMQALTIRLAKALNRLMGRRGQVFADRYHARVLRSPSQVRHALAYVLSNHRSHLARLGEPVALAAPDPFSSAPSFDGWNERLPITPPRATSRARTWLLTAGWRRRGLLSLSDVPRDRAA